MWQTLSGTYGGFHLALLIDRAHSALHAEAEACAKGIQCATQMGMERIEEQTDDTDLAKAINRAEYDFSSYGVVVFKEIRSMTITDFPQVLISVCPRSCNKVADCLAAFVLV